MKRYGSQAIVAVSAFALLLIVQSCSSQQDVDMSDSTVNEAHFILYVADQQKSTDFYSEVLGDSPSLNVPGMTQFKLPGGSTLGLMPEEGIKQLLGENLPSQQGASAIPRAELYLIVDDANEILKAALRAGAIQVSSVQARNWGDDVGYCLDFDGNLLAFAQSQ